MKNLSQVQSRCKAASRRTQKSKNRLRRRNKSVRHEMHLSGVQLLKQLRCALTQHLPDLLPSLAKLPDPRGRKAHYSIVEIVFAAVTMYILKMGSRNAMNNARFNGSFRDNYRKVFGHDLPHMDTVNDVLTKLDPAQLEAIVPILVRTLIRQKVLARFRVFDHYVIAVDGTGVMTVKEGHCESCLHRTSAGGETTYFHSILEAKLVAENGFCISIATEWIENSEEFEKQDCELKAFSRLAAKLAASFPRLRIMIAGDGLYPNATFMKICSKYQWRYIAVLKDGSLPLVWEQIEAGLSEGVQCSGTLKCTDAKGKKVEYTWIRNLNHKGHTLSWIQIAGDNDHSRWSFITNVAITAKNVRQVAAAGRLRWRIENEGFNCQKNLGYALHHKMSRTSQVATKNFYVCLQIAHLINQLVVLAKAVERYWRHTKVTLRHLWKEMLATLFAATIQEEAFSSRKVQFRY